MTSPSLITVFGATGAQGGSVVRSLLQNQTKSFAIRGITRNPDSNAAKALEAAGVEVVKADGLNKDEITKAFAGSWGAFVNTNSDDPALRWPGGPTEVDLGRIIVDAAADAGVQHFVYSGMASASEITQGAVPVAAFDHKHAIGTYAVSKGTFSTVTIVSAGWYFENFLVQEMAPVFGGFPSVPDEQGGLTFRSPTWGGKEDVPFIAIADDYGDLVHGVFLDPAKYEGKMVHGVSDIQSLGDVVSSFTRATGTKARFEPLPSWKDLETYGIEALETVKGMFGFCQHSGGRYYGVPTENDTAASLKRAAAEAKGKTEEDAKLMTIEKWFKREFSG